MRNIVDIGEQGAEYMDVTAPVPTVAIEGIERFTPIIDRFPVTRVATETDDGTKRNIEVHTLLLDNPQVFGLVWELAMYEPMVFARKGNRVKMGILSPNFDEEGIDRLPAVKVLPLQVPYPLISKGRDLLPDARMATMLAGSAHAEGRGSGGHTVRPEKDYEHKLTFLGAVSLGKNTISENGKHVQHAVRRQTSVATGLTNGTLGNIFAKNIGTSEFTGYGLPLTYHSGQTEPGDAIFIPKGFLHNEEAYGVHYTDAARTVYGAGLQIMYQRYGIQAVSNTLVQIARTTK